MPLRTRCVLYSHTLLVCMRVRARVCVCLPLRVALSVPPYPTWLPVLQALGMTGCQTEHAEGFSLTTMLRAA